MTCVVEQPESKGTFVTLRDLFSAYWSVGTQENYAYGGHTIYLDSHNPAEEFQSLIDQSWFDRQTRGVWVEYALYTPDADIVSIVQLGTIFTPTGDLVPEARFTHAAMRDLEFPMDTPANQLYTLNQVILYVYVLFKLIYELYCCYEFPHGAHLCGNHSRLAISAPRPCFRLKLGHDIPLIQSTDWSERKLTQTMRDHELKGA